MNRNGRWDNVTQGKSRWGLSVRMPEEIRQAVATDITLPWQRVTLSDAICGVEPKILKEKLMGRKRPNLWLAIGYLLVKNWTLYWNPTAFLWSPSFQMFSMTQAMRISGLQSRAYKLFHAKKQQRLGSFLLTFRAWPTHLFFFLPLLWLTDEKTFASRPRATYVFFFIRADRFIRRAKKNIFLKRRRRHWIYYFF